MSRDVFEIIQGMDMKSIELQLVMQCSPLIAGLKISNLLIVSDSDERAVRAILAKTGISCYRLWKSNHKMTYLLFRREQLKSFLECQEVSELLVKEGYRDFEFGKLLNVFQKRYAAFLSGQQTFPHEMGLFLGYPPEDVKGFTENEGKNFLYAGYWKVYENKEEKMSLFEKFENARTVLLNLIAQGFTLHEAICMKQIGQIC